MNSEYWSRLKPIAMNALDLPEEAQAAYIHDMCGDDVDLLAAALALVGAPMREGLTRTPLIRHFEPAGEGG